MNELWLPLFPILLTDILNPVLFAALVFAVGTSHPVAKSSTVLLGHTVMYFSMGILLAIGLEWLVDRLDNPHTVDFYIELTLGVLLVGLAIATVRSSGDPPTREGEKLGFAQAFGLGAVINLIGIPFAVPYFAALAQILKAELSVTHSLTVLIVYNLAYAVPFALVPVLRAALGESSAPVLQRINHGLDRVSGVLMPLLLGGIGVALAADAIHYLVKGAPLW